jgi:hypothetical protein
LQVYWPRKIYSGKFRNIENRYSNFGFMTLAVILLIAALSFFLH